MPESSDWIYLSFADTKLPKGQQWLGACIVKANDPAEAVKQAWRLGINPGGEVAFQEIEHLPPPSFRNRLMISHDELRDMGRAIDGNSTLRGIDGEVIDG